MNKGLQSSLYNGLPLKDEINTALAQNVDFFDIFFDTWDPSAIPDDTYQLITSLNTSKNLKFTVHLPINFYEMDYSQKQRFYEFIAYLKPKTITIHFNTLTYDLLKELVRVAYENESILCVENTIPDMHNIYGLGYLPFMIEAKKSLEYTDFKDAFGATVDTGHAFANGINPDFYVKELTKNGIKIPTVHLHDNDGHSDSHQPLGTGNIPFAPFFDELKKTQQNPYMVIEHWTDFPKSLVYIENYENCKSC